MQSTYGTAVRKGLKGFYSIAYYSSNNLHASIMQRRTYTSKYAINLGRRGSSC